MATRPIDRPINPTRYPVSTPYTAEVDRHGRHRRSGVPVADLPAAGRQQGIAGLTPAPATARRSATPAGRHRAPDFLQVGWNRTLCEPNFKEVYVTKLNMASGGQGLIHELATSDGRRLVGKELRPGINQDNLLHEVEALAKLYAAERSDVPDNVVKAYGIASVSGPAQQKKTLLIMDKIDGPDGFDIMNNPAILRMPDLERSNLIKYTIHSLIKAVYAGKRAGVVHCDLKPENYMFDSRGTLKVIDWGNWGHHGGRPRGGTIGYGAPESSAHVETVTVPREIQTPMTIVEPVIVEERRFLRGSKVRIVPRYRSIMHSEIRLFHEQRMIGPSVDEKSDLYSIGVILNELMQQYSISSPLGNAFVRSLMAKDRSQRIDIDSASSHRFLTGVSKSRAVNAIAIATRAAQRSA